MHQPPIPHIDAEDPEIAELIRAEERRQAEKIRLIPSENYVSGAVLEAVGTVLTNKYSEGYPGKRYYEGQQFDRPARAARDRARQGAVRRGARQRPAVLGLAGEPGRLPGVPQAGRHGHGHGAADGRPPDPRLERLDHRQVLPRRCTTASARRPAGSTSTRSASSRCKERPKLIFCGGTAIPRTIDFAAFASIAAEVGAMLVADIAHIAGLVAGGAHPSPVGYADVVSTTTHKTLRGPRGAMLLCRRRAREGDRQGRVPRPAGRPAQPHDRRHRGRAARGGAAGVQGLRGAGRRQREGARRGAASSAASSSSRAAPTTT